MNLDKAAREALYALDSLCSQMTCCTVAHHRNEYHDANVPCPALIRINTARDNLKYALEQRGNEDV